MDQSEANRFGPNNNQQDLSIEINNELKQTKVKNQNHGVQKIKLNLQDNEPVMFKKPYNTQVQYEKNLIKPKYGKPIINNNNNKKGKVISGNHYIDNQVNPDNFEAMKFGFVPTSMICPYCKNNTVTIIEETFNFGTCFLFVLIILLIPILIIVAAFSGCKSAHYNRTCRCDCCCCGTGSCDCKCCFDSYHYCQHCGKQIGKRNSCLELCPCIDACC